MQELMVSGVEVAVVRKRIKNLHLGVYPPHGRVRVAAPLAVSDDAVRLAVVTKLVWIKRQREKFKGQARQSQRDMISGESHYFLGHRYRLNVIEQRGVGRVVERHKARLDLYVRPGTNIEQREQLLQRWYRERLKEMILPLVEKWQAVLGVRVTEWGIRRMKTKWGTSNIGSRRIWLNLELAKKPVRCLEYIIVHELVHLLERHHNERFISLMDKHLPTWRERREELNHAPLAHENWDLHHGQADLH
jgi:predicted metal-dependent hydrolase